jgi:hypothetical protein
MLLVACDQAPSVDAAPGPASDGGSGIDASGTSAVDASKPRLSCAGRWELGFTMESSSCGTVDAERESWFVEKTGSNMFTIRRGIDDPSPNHVIDEAAGRGCHFRFEDNGTPDQTNDVSFVAYYDLESLDASTVVGSELDVLTRISDESVLCDVKYRINGRITE